MIPDDNNNVEDEDSKCANNTPFAIKEQIKDNNIEDAVHDDAYNNDADNNNVVEKEEEADDVKNENEKTEESEDEDEKVLSQSASNCYNLQKTDNNVRKQ